jgi:hypothetical protein
MRANRTISAGLTMIFLATCSALPAWADRGDRDKRGKSPAQRPHVEKRQPVKKHPGYVRDRKHHHNRYYPPRGHRVPALPHDHRKIPYRGKRYYYDRGVWYVYSGTRFVVVFPPIGIAVPILPPFYTTIWVGSVPYYYANGVYYVWRPAQRVYVVTDPPTESSVLEEEEKPQELFVYPKQGQSEERQARDRYQCHTWATEQTGFDPTRSGGNVPESEYYNKRSDYQRAMKACLEARGYSVQ